MSIFAAVRALVHDSALPPKAIADECGIRYGYLMRAADDQQDDVQFQARWIAPVTKAAQNDVLIRAIAVECGGVFVRVARPGARPSDILTGITEVSREFSESVSALTACLDGATSPEKLAAIQQLTELIEKAAAAREQLEAAVSA